nr:hypothetical protein [Wenjunlia tyrosinilytica]
MNAASAAGSRGVENFNRALAGALTPPEPSPLPPVLFPLPSSIAFTAVLTLAATLTTALTALTGGTQ